MEFVDESNVPDAPDAEVDEQVILLNSAQVQHEARYIAEQGNVTDAETLLRQFDDALTANARYSTSQNLQGLSENIKSFADQMPSYSHAAGMTMGYASKSMSLGRGLSGATKNMAYMAPSSTMENFVTEKFTDTEPLKDDEKSEEE